MTNSEIIGRYMIANKMPATTILHTYSSWKKLGYAVKRGEKSQHKIPIWKKSTKKVEKEDGEEETVDNGRFFLKESAFFTREQVERIEK